MGKQSDSGLLVCHSSLILFAFSCSEPFQFPSEHLWETLLWHSVNQDSLTKKELAGFIQRQNAGSCNNAHDVNSLEWGTPLDSCLRWPTERGGILYARRKGVNVSSAARQNVTKGRKGQLRCSLKSLSVFYPFHCNCCLYKLCQPMPTWEERNKEQMRDYAR